MAALEAARAARAAIPNPPNTPGVESLVASFISKVDACQSSVDRLTSMVEAELAAALADTTSALAVCRLQVGTPPNLCVTRCAHGCLLPGVAPRRCRRSLWNYEPTLDPTSTQFAALVTNHNNRLATRVGANVTCPNGCTCDWNSRCVWWWRAVCGKCAYYYVFSSSVGLIP